MFDTIVPKVFLLDQQLWGHFLNFDLLVHLIDCPNVSTTNYNLQMGNFVYQHWGCTSINRPYFITGIFTFI